ncbi:hypothetical protein ACPPVO_38185 [Dactylosporangium sp. McL0621]|uniref:hypothetical protein n=1 Tax=Dactylosporangium sp. McL0621 TaxID=3415678 RepID=UPI003CF78B3D
MFLRPLGDGEHRITPDDALVLRDGEGPALVAYRPVWAGPGVRAVRLDRCGEEWRDRTWRCLYLALDKVERAGLGRRTRPVVQGVTVDIAHLRPPEPPVDFGYGYAE